MPRPVGVTCRESALGDFKVAMHGTKMTRAYFIGAMLRIDR